MSKITLSEQTAPATASSGTGHFWTDSTISKPAYTDDSGRHWLLAPQRNWSTADQSPGTSDAYLTGSSLLIPSFGVQAGMRVIWYVAATKTAAGTATAVWQVRIGAAQSTADTSRLTITQGAQSAVADQGIAQVMLTVRSIGASGVIRGDMAWIGHHATATGFGAGAGATSSAFDTSALGGSYIGLSVNAGASAAWTVTQVQSEIIS